MRDALVAAVTSNIFNSHCDRITMANIAQTVNVLQSVILTQGEKMLLTPTYHVFDMYKGHQDASLLESSVETNTIGTDAFSIPDLHLSASQTKDGVIHFTLANLSLDIAHDVSCQVGGQTVKSAMARILTGDVDAKNEFDATDRVKPECFDDITISGDHLQFNIPPCAVMEFQLHV